MKITLLQIHSKKRQLIGQVATTTHMRYRNVNPGNEMNSRPQKMMPPNMPPQQMQQGNAICGPMHQVLLITPMAKPASLMEEQQQQQIQQQQEQQMLHQQQKQQQKQRRFPGMEQYWTRYSNPGGMSLQDSEGPVGRFWLSKWIRHKTS